MAEGGEGGGIGGKGILELLLSLGNSGGDLG